MLHALIEQLESTDSSEREGYVERFENILEQIALLNEPACIPMLLKFLEDDAPYDEAMFSIIHTIEYFEGEVFVEAILDALPWFCTRSPRWATIIHMRIINSPDTYAAYAKRLETLGPDGKTAARQLLEALKGRDKRFEDCCNGLLAKL
jgi:hypothetical protein